MTNTDTPSGIDGDEDMQSTTGSAATADGRRYLATRGFLQAITSQCLYRYRRRS